MKQHITLDQIKTLSPQGKKEYKLLQKKCKWFDSEMVWLNDNIYFLTIGQMIEILDKNGLQQIDLSNSKRKEIFLEDNFYYGNLCDALWEATKYILESTEL